MRVLMAAAVWSFALLAAPSGVRAGEPSPVWKDGWTINVPGPSNWVSDGTPSPFYLAAHASTPFVPGPPRTRTGSPTTRSAARLASAASLGLATCRRRLACAWPSRSPQRLHAGLRSAPLSRRRPAPGLGRQQAAAVVVGRRVARWRRGAVQRPHVRQQWRRRQSAPAELFEQWLGRQCRWPARPVILVRYRVEADARLSCRLFQRLAGLQSHRRRRRTTPTASITGR